MDQTAQTYNEVRGNNIKEMLIYLTSQCQLSCTHCFLHKEQTVKQLSLQDLDWLTRTFKIRSVNLLGGEPLLHPHLIESLDLFEKITISTNGIVIALNNSRTTELIDAFKHKGKNITIQLSIQGNKEDTDAVRGTGVWDKVIAAATLLREHNIPFYFLSNYARENLRHLPDVINMVNTTFHAPLALFPEIGKPSLTASEQKWLFSMIVQKNNEHTAKNLVDLPNFYQWLGLPGRCGAGSERLSVTYNKEIVPCHLDFTYYLGKIGTALPVINHNRELFLKSGKQIKSDCLFCNKSDICRSGCYMAGAYSGCPLKENFTLEQYAFATDMDTTILSNQISSIKTMLRDSLICG